MAQLLRLKQNHTTTRDSSGGSLREIFDFEHHCHCRLQLNDLTRVEAELFVIIKYSVHVFNPNGIDGAIEDNPLTVRSKTLCTITNLNGQNTILPLTRIRVQSTVKLGLLN